ncbi:hypothetical protein KIN20_036066 [Parelaphostrongylus tenuis]|uniref:Uncharacterized protein n=1 Tax=Parelaphostrongylus tenuis TaxID=148309 RepID=A0AAD5RCF6_PARTN|nr:hypothetical protein KIN20_036066 [Parelaphostrongylus tenuis]
MNQSAVSQLDAFHSISILESPTFHLNTISRLHFNYAMEVGIFSSSLLRNEILHHREKLCFSSATTVQTKSWKAVFKVEGRKGEDYIEMLPSDTKVYLIAKLAEGSDNSVSRSGRLTIHRLQLTDTLDTNAC